MSLSKRQKAKRVQGIGASEIAVIVGKSKWKSPIEIFEEKVIGRQSFSSYASELGTSIEEPLAKVYAKKHGVIVARVDTLVHPDKPFAIATPDRAVYMSRQSAGDIRRLKTDVRDAERLLQIKSTNWRMRGFWGEEGTDKIPDEYLCQVQWEMGVSGVQACDVFVDFDKTRGFTYPIAFRPAVFEAMYELAERFMVDHVYARVAPSPDDTENYEETLTRFFPQETVKRDLLDPLIPETQPELYLALQWLAIADEVKAHLESMSQKARNAITGAIGDRSGFVGPWGKVTWLKNRDSEVVDYEKAFNEAKLTAALALQVMPSGKQRAELELKLKGLELKHTSTRPGARVLRKTFNGELLNMKANGLELFAGAVEISKKLDLPSPKIADEVASETNPEQNAHGSQTNGSKTK